MSQQPPYQPPGTPHGYVPPPQRPTANNAVTALVLGILGLVLCGPFTAIPAIIVGRNTVREIDASQGRLDGRGMAQAGFVLGIVGTVLGVLTLLLVVVLFVFGAVVSSSFESSCSTVSDDSGSFSVHCD